MTGRRPLGEALYRLPGALRSVIPRAMRESIRQRIGPFAPWETGFSHTPPPLGDGEKAGPPDFVGIGAQRCGTTWWFELLAAHSQVFQRPDVHKERHFFAPFATRPFGDAEIAQYHRWFPRPAGALAGEWTPDYLCQPWSAPLLDKAAPDSRLLVLVRDPVERFLSGMAHTAVPPGSNLGSVTADAVSRGFYASSLQRWVETVGTDRMLVLQYEQCVADTTGELRRTQQFLGLGPEPMPVELRRPVSPTRGAKPSLSEDARRRLVDLYGADVDELMACFSHLDRRLWPNFSGD